MKDRAGSTNQIPSNETPFEYNGRMVYISGRDQTHWILRVIGTDEFFRVVVLVGK